MRNSSFEKCRILLFFMVVTIHVSSPYFNTNHIVGLFNWQFTNLLDGCSRIAVNCFILISGYFMIHQSSGIPHLKKLLQPLTLFLLPYYGMYAYEHGIIKGIYPFLSDFMAADGHFYHLWFFQVMIVLYLLSGYINIVLNTLTRSGYKKLLATLLLLYSILPTLGFLLECEFFKTSLFVSRASLFILLYCIGGYIKKYKLSFPRRKILPLFLCSQLLIVFLTILYNYKTSPLFLLHKLRGIPLEYPLSGFIGVAYDYNSIFVISASILFFLLFTQREYHSPKINAIAKHVFNGYIIHVFWIGLLAKIPSISPFIRFQNPDYPIYVLLTIILVFTLSLCSSWVIHVLGLCFRHQSSATPK